MKIICIGRNYVAHAQELGNQVPSEPVIFLKPDTALLPRRNPFYIPEFTTDVHYECEIVVRIGRLGKHIEEKFAHTYIDGIGIGIDFTARDVQEKCKQKGLPWEKAKAFDGSAPVSEHFLDPAQFPNLQDISFSLQKNGSKVQSGNTGNMIFPISAIISYVSQFFTLKIGDLIFTGTPEGVGPVAIGDRLDAFIGDQSMLRVNIR
jgi:2-keto-4-pentenoate hydratase/2-oxohepta-3-ene-1,7-dioic acid hydratase in catechol pathway